jgi:hypothetical protein
MKKGRDEDSGLFRNFRLKVKGIQADLEREALDVIRFAQQGGEEIKETKVEFESGYKGNIKKVTKSTRSRPSVWQAAAWYLERRHRETYGREPINPETEKSAEEFAKEIKEAADAMFQTVPVEV